VSGAASAALWNDLIVGVAAAIVLSMPRGSVHERLCELEPLNRLTA
jgi:hypothetical protein